MSLLDKLQDWLKSVLIRRLEKGEMMELKRVTTGKVTLNSVHLHNEMLIRNKLWLPYTILRVKGDLFNEQQLKVGWIDLEEPVRVASRSEETLSIDTHLSHITAFFNVLRFWLRDEIPLELEGKVWIKLLWWDFSLPLTQTLYIKRELISYAAKAAPPQPPAVVTETVAEGPLAPVEPINIVESDPISVSEPPVQPAPTTEAAAEETSIQQERPRPDL